MKIFLYKKGWRSGEVQINMDPPFIQIIKINIDTKSQKDYVKIKFRRNPMLEKSGIYEFKMDLFDNGYPEEILLFQRNYRIMLDAS